MKIFKYHITGIIAVVCLISFESNAQYTLQGTSTSVIGGMITNSNNSMIIFGGSFSDGQITTGTSYTHVGEYIAANHIDFKPVSIDEMAIYKLDLAKVYPNPSTNALHIDFTTLQSGIISIYTIDGSLIKKILTTNEKQLVIDVESYKPGSYLLFIETENKYQYQQFQKL